MTIPILEISDLHIEFLLPRGTLKAVRGINLSIDKGQIFGVVGESGCGKSVTARAILGLITKPGKIVSGSIRFNGTELPLQDIQETNPFRGTSIGLIFQDPSAALNPVFTIGQQMYLAIRQHHLAGNEQERVMNMLGEVGLPQSADLLNSYPHQLSGGMQQRAMIAMALVLEPELLIADEPTTALDVTIQAQILDLLIHLKNVRGLTILLITHDMGVVAETCEEVAVFYAGRVVENGPITEIFSGPRHPYTRGLLAALPNPDHPNQELKMIPGSVPSGFEAPPGCAFADRCDSVMPTCRDASPPATVLDNGQQVFCYRIEDTA